MNETEVIRLLRDYAAIIFPKHFAGLMAEGRATLQDVEVAAAVAAHLAWGRREMIVRDCRRAMDEMGWQPYEYVMAGKYRSDSTSLHRTVKWSEFAGICGRLREFYRDNESLEVLTPGQMRVRVWKGIDKRELIIPLDVHVHRSAANLGITARRSADIRTAEEITRFLLKVFPEDPVLGDFALFAVAASGGC